MQTAIVTRRTSSLSATLVKASRSLAARLRRWIQRSHTNAIPVFEPLQQRLQLTALPVVVGSEFQVFSDSAGKQISPDVAISDQGFLVIRAGDGTPPGRIYGQFYTAAGVKYGGEFTVTTTGSDVSNPAIAYAPNGQAVVVWQDTDAGASSIYARRIGSDLQFQGDPFLVDSRSAGFQAYPKVAMRDDGSFMVTWTGLEGDGYDIGVSARMFDPNGDPTGKSFNVNTYTTNFQYLSNVAADSQAGFTISWISDNDTRTAQTVMAQRYDSSGNTNGSNITVTTYTSAALTPPIIASAYDGSFVVGWTANGVDSSQTSAQVQRFDSLGQQIGSPIQANTITFGDQTLTDLVMDPSGNFIAFYTSDDASASDTYAQTFDYNGAFAGSVFKVNSYTSAYHQTSAVAALNGDGSLVVVWDSDGQDGDQDGLFAQRYTWSSNLAPVASAVPQVTLYGADSHSINLTKYFSDDNTPAQDMTYSVVSNSNGSVITNINFTDGILSFDVDASSSTQTKLVIQATDRGGLTVDSNIDIVSLELFDFSANLDLQDYPRVSSTNLYDLYNIPTLAQPFLSFLGARSYKGQPLYDDFSVSGNDLDLTLSGTLGKGTFTLSATIFGVASVYPTIALDVTHQTSPVVTDVVEPPTPVDSAINSVDMTFSQDIDVDSFNWESVTLTRDAGANLVTASTALTFELVSGTTYRISGLAGITASNGSYTLALVNQGVTNTDGNPLDGAAQATWTMDAVGPTVKNLSSYPAPRLVPVTSVAVRMSDTVDLDTFTWEDIILTRDAGPNLSSADITIAVSGWDPSVYVISLPTSLISGTGAYSLSVVGPGILTTGGLPFTNTNSTSWTLAAKVLNMSQFPTLRTNPVTTVAVRLSEPANLTTFTWQDLLLTRDADGNIATDQISIAVSGWDANVYVISLPTSLVSASGNYQLTVVGSGIRTASADVLYGNSSSTSWSQAGRVLNLSQFPAPRTLPVTSVAVRFSDVINLSTFNWEDLTLTLDAGSNLANDQITIAVSGWDPKVYVITFPSELTSTLGVYALTVNGAGIQTSAGNPLTNSSATGWTIQ